MKLYNNIRELHFGKGDMTQKELAEEVGVSRQAISAIETGRHAPSIDVALRIADALGACVEDVFSLEPHFGDESEDDDDDRDGMIISVGIPDDDDRDGMIISVGIPDEDDPVEPDCTD